MHPATAINDATLARIEDASINASAPTQQLWLDGWLVRLSPGKARRARCIQPVAAGRMPLAWRLQACARAFADAGLPMLARITPYSLPEHLDADLTNLGWTREDPTPVLVRHLLATGADEALPDAPAGCHWDMLDASTYARVVGALRASPESAIQAHAHRLTHSPIAYVGLALRRRSDAAFLTCAQFARQGDLVGLYDVHTHAEHRGRGLAGLVCKRLLSIGVNQGARTAYLQVEAQNIAARRSYERLGFAWGYSYHYRLAPTPH